MCLLKVRRPLRSTLNGRRALSQILSGGEGGIRTHGTVPRTQHFQCCQSNHSCTSPKKPLALSFCPAKSQQPTANSFPKSIAHPGGRCHVGPPGLSPRRKALTSHNQFRQTSLTANLAYKEKIPFGFLT